MMPASTPRTRPVSVRTAKAAPARVIDDKGKKGDANQAVITALIDAEHAVCARPAQA
jgi:hypothetical protein